MGGCDATASAKKPSRDEKKPGAGSTMQRCAAPRVIARVGEVAASSFCSAEASASGLRVNWAPVASARNSRFRLTAMARILDTIGATTSVTSQSTSTTRASGLPPSLPRPPPPVRTPPLDREPRSIRPMPSDISAIAPTIAGEQRHEPHVEVPHVGHLVGHDTLQLVPRQCLQQTFGHRDAGRGGVATGRERVRIARPAPDTPGAWARPRRSPSPRPR